MNLKLPHNFRNYFKVLSSLKTALIGIALIGVFGYTAYLVNGATNVKSDSPGAVAGPKITFDKATLKSLANRNNVPDQTPLGTLGKPDPMAWLKKNKS